MNSSILLQLFYIVLIKDYCSWSIPTIMSALSVTSTSSTHRSWIFCKLWAKASIGKGYDKFKQNQSITRYTWRLKWICISADDSILFRLYLGSKAALTANLAHKQKLKQKPFWRAYTGDFIILSPFYRFTPFLAVRSLMQLKGWPKLAVMTGKLVYRQIAQFVCYFFMGPLVECIG